ncbi:hypothetical protein J3E68DRAFT_408677 [Trichoderma sp. SZMC 28012]
MASNEYYQQGYPPQQGGYPPQGYPPQGYPQQPQAVNKPSHPQTLIDTPCADSIDSKYTPEPNQLGNRASHLAVKSVPKSSQGHSLTRRVSQSYGPPQGQYGPPQGQYGPPQGQAPMQYEQAPPPDNQRGRGGDQGCLMGCIAALCCCCAIEEGCECCIDLCECFF